MALLTDGLVSEAEDLLVYESDVNNLAASEKINLKAKATLAQTEVSAQLQASTRRPGYVFRVDGFGWRSTASDAAFPRFELDQVVVTPPLKLWHTFQTLALIYRDASGRATNDKHLAKWRDYKSLAKWAQELLSRPELG